MHTRSGTADQAARTAGSWAEALVSAGVPRVFQKTDSLLRGHVTRETAAILAAAGKSKCVLCPANPRRGRTIQGGRYFVAGMPLDQTVFARDPVHPRRSADVRELLGETTACIETPDIESLDDLATIAAGLDSETLPAGGADFFAAILQAAGAQPVAAPPMELDTPRLIVCGSLAAWQSDRAGHAATHGVPVVLLPEFSPSKLSGGITMLAIGPESGCDPHALESELAERVAQVVASNAPPAWLLLEGGATARAVIDRCGWRSFRALGELAPGIVGLAIVGASGPLLVIKPGSYPWPNAVWASFTSP
jgi:uncharacterized protein YgbK (DUF1537 family)